MIPEGLDAGRDASLTLPRAIRRGLGSRSTSRTTALLAAMRRVLDLLSVWRKRAASRSMLASLDDRMLRDIGLTRGDVERELTKPFWQL